MALLAINALFFTDNGLGQLIQFALIGVLVIHDVDEKRWGVDALGGGVPLFFALHPQGSVGAV